MINIIPKPNKVVIGNDTFIIKGEINLQDLQNMQWIKRQIVKELRLGYEGYRLTINHQGVHITAESNKGIFYGEQSLYQMIVEYGNKLPHVTIEDRPNKTYRGFMLDVARHFFTVDQVKKQIKLMSMHKLNVFHFHITEDQGWRMSVKDLPRLTEIGSFRKETVVKGKADGTPVSGFYTKDDLREIVEYAKEHFVEIIPEIDMPGHVTAAIASYPDLSCTGEQLEVGTRYGVYKDVLCAGKESTYQFVFSVLDEVLEVFQPKRIHLGGDEVLKDRWKDCPHCQKRIRDNNLKNEEELQGYFLNRVSHYLKDKGVESIVWNEALKSDNLDKEINVQYWMEGRKNARVAEALNNGRKVIISEFYHLYLDYPHYMTPISKIYDSANLIPKMQKSAEKNIIGYEAALWTEHIETLEELERMVFPRLTALAEVGWTDYDQHNYHDFMKRLEIFKQIFDREKVKYTYGKELDERGLIAKIKTHRYLLKKVSWNDIKNMMHMN